MCATAAMIDLPVSYYKNIVPKNASAFVSFVCFLWNYYHKLITRLILVCFILHVCVAALV